MSKFDSFEGGWEEIVEKHSEALAGQRVRVVILPEVEKQPLDLALTGILAEINDLEVKRYEPPYKKDDAFGNIIVEKYQKQGFKL